MAGELELAGLIAQVGADAREEEIFAAQWRHESDNEPRWWKLRVMPSRRRKRRWRTKLRVMPSRRRKRQWWMKLRVMPNE
jgi:hypothetical protein